MLIIIDVAVAARTVYCFLRQYFATRIPLAAAQGVPVHMLADQHSEESTEKTALVNGKPNGHRKPIRVYMDGCFDAMHFGHANALRQARALGDVLVVGINPEVEILRHKGPPIMSDVERKTAVEGVKWVDEVLPDAPYVVTPEFLDELINKHNIDIIAHGDDPCVGADGNDVYAAVKAMGRFRTVKRTEGVSSTDIVQRMLGCTSDHHMHPDNANGNNGSSNGNSETPQSRVSKFLPTTRRLLQFAGGKSRAPKRGERVIYVDGSFDMFHAGHIDFLKRCASMGDFLLVGIHDDASVNNRKGANFPIMNLHERTLSVLACRHVDEVIIGAPSSINHDMVTTMNIACVVRGTHTSQSEEEERYAVARELGIYEEIHSISTLDVNTILQRVRNQRDAYIQRNKKKTKAETEYLTVHKQYVPES